MQLLASQAPGLPPELQEAALVPAQEFLLRGGSFELSLAPPEPLLFEQLQLLALLPPAQALDAIGFSAQSE